MNYDPTIYWPARYAREGALACAKRGMGNAESDAQARVFWTHISPRTPRPCARFLDFGCGPGRMAPFAAPLVGEYIGADACAEAARLAVAANPDLRFVHLTGVRLPWPGGHFDCVLACTVLQHVVDDNQFTLWAGEIARVTKPGGTIVVLDGVGCRAAHARSRTPEEVRSALGMDMDRPAETVDAESRGSHWCAGYQCAAATLPEPSTQKPNSGQ